MAATNGDAPEPAVVVPYAPGRLGKPDMVIKEEPRVHPGVLAFLKEMANDGMASSGPPRDMPFEELVGAWSVDMEKLFLQGTVGLLEKRPPIHGVETSTEIIKGVDGNDIVLYISKPTHVTGAIPCVVHFHGGGMFVLSASMENFHYWRNAMASLDMIVVGVEFRNSGGMLGPHPFPAGLNDCSSAVQWCHDNKVKLGYSKLILNGESGGGNLSLATVLKAKKEGKLEQIQGVYALCPYIHGDYDTPDPNMASWVENHGYELNLNGAWTSTLAYDPAGHHTFNPLAWPVNAEVEDLEGLPPVAISVNELDPLRDEGLAFYRKALKAGVSASSTTRNGLTHCSEMSLWNHAPEQCWLALRDIKSFTQTL